MHRGNADSFQSADGSRIRAADIRDDLTHVNFNYLERVNRVTTIACQYPGKCVSVTASQSELHH
jgi:hypothetical protein